MLTNLTWALIIGGLWYMVGRYHGMNRRQPEINVLLADNTKLEKELRVAKLHAEMATECITQS